MPRVRKRQVAHGGEENAWGKEGMQKVASAVRRFVSAPVAQLCYYRIVRRVVLSDTAVRLFRALPKARRLEVKDGIRLHLQENDPVEETRNKFRLRRPSAHAEYELRLGDIRVFYRMRDETVEVVLIGEKRGNRLLIGREEFEI